MSAHAPRSIDEYLRQLRAALEGAGSGADPGRALRRRGVPARRGRGAPGQVGGRRARAHREHLRRARGSRGRLSRHRGEGEGGTQDPGIVRGRRAPGAGSASSACTCDARSYTSLFYMLLALATGIVYFTIVVTGLSLSVRLRDSHHRRAVLPRLHRHHARDRPRRRAAAGGDQRRAHAAPPGASRVRRRAGGRASARC